ncbi:MAG: acyl-CoA thioesterase [Desulfococcaceae bacterium]
MTQKQTYKCQINVRFRDLDAMGHVNNAVYFTYFEEGRKNFFRDISDSGKVDFPFIMAHIGCDFLKPVKLSDQPVLKMQISSIGSKSFGLRYELVNGSDESPVFAKGESVQVCFDYKENRTIPVPGNLKEKLSAFFVEEAAE